MKKLKTLNPDIEIDHIDELYQDEKIDIKAEQEKLLNNDTIIFQFPMYCQNKPHFLCRWFEEVYEYGFAYGKEFKLKDKTATLIAMKNRSLLEILLYYFF